MTTSESHVASREHWFSLDLFKTPLKSLTKIFSSPKREHETERTTGGATTSRRDAHGDPSAFGFHSNPLYDAHREASRDRHWASHSNGSPFGFNVPHSRKRHADIRESWQDPAHLPDLHERLFRSPSKMPRLDGLERHRFRMFQSPYRYKSPSPASHRPGLSPVDAMARSQQHARSYTSYYNRSPKSSHMTQFRINPDKSAALGSTFQLASPNEKLKSPKEWLGASPSPSDALKHRTRSEENDVASLPSSSKGPSTANKDKQYQRDELQILKDEAEVILSKAVLLAKRSIDTSEASQSAKRYAPPTGFDVNSLETYRKLVNEMNGINSKPYAMSPDLHNSIAVESTDGGVADKKKSHSTDSKESSPAHVATISLSTPSRSSAQSSLEYREMKLKMKVQAALSKKSLESAEEKEKQLEIEALHSKLDTLEISRLQGIPLWQEEEEEEEEEEEFDELKIRSLSPEEEELYHSTMEGPDDEVVTSHKSARLSLAVRDLRSMLPGEWLTDENINFFMALLNDRNRRRVESKLKPCCYFTNTFFFNKLYKDTKKYNYSGVKKWTRPAKLGGIKTIECDKIIVPIHQHVHWCTAVIDVAKQELIYYDSMLGRDESVLENLARWIEDEMKDKGGKPIDTSDWPRKYPREIPVQKNHYDCGVFAIKFAEYSGLDAPLTFSQEDMPLLRQRIVIQFLQTNLDNNNNK